MFGINSVPDVLQVLTLIAVVFLAIGRRYETSDRHEKEIEELRADFKQLSNAITVLSVNVARLDERLGGHTRNEPYAC